MTNAEVTRIGDGAEAGGRGTRHGQLDVVPLLRSYRDAIALASSPPASLRLWRPLRLIHRLLRPRWTCLYFTTRYVRRRTDALERALAARTALGDADDNDHAESEAIARFRSSLPPAPSRIMGVAAVIAAIVLAQALVNRLFDLFDLLGDSTAKSIEKAFGELGPNPDVKSFGDLASALVSANYIQHGVILIAVCATLYLFGRPLASGYRLSYMCLGRAERLGRLRRRSDLCVAAARLDSVAQEHAAVRAARTRFRREAPIDLLIKGLPWLVIAYWLIGFTRFGDEPGVSHLRLIAWTLASVAIGVAIAWASSRLRSRRRVLRVLAGTIGVAFLTAALVGIAGFTPSAALRRVDDTIWFAIAGLVLARFGWLALIARSRGCPGWWVVVPLAVTCLLGAVSPYDPYARGSADDARQWARESAGVTDLPKLGRGDLQIMLATHQRLNGSDLRAQDLHGLSLRWKQLVDAQLTVADLGGADLRHADLQGADLRGAVANGARIDKANLVGADLRCSDLRGASLRGARLDGARLEAAIADETTRWPAAFDPSGHHVDGPDALDMVGDASSGSAAFYDYVSGCLF